MTRNPPGLRGWLLSDTIDSPLHARAQSAYLGWRRFAANPLSLLGLVSALAGDGAADWLSWGTLAVPVLAVVWAMRRRRA